MKYDATSIIGLSKNAGKTTLLNYLIEKYTDLDARVGIASIGVDGEERDVWFGQKKPSIHVPAKSLVVTTSDGLKSGNSEWRILEKLNVSSSAGDLYIAESINGGTVKLLGIPSIDNFHYVFRVLSKYKVDHLLLDGAYDRFSNADPKLTSNTFVALGASLHANEDQFWRLVRKKIYNLFIPVVTNSEVIDQVQKRNKQQIIIYKDGQWIEIPTEHYFSGQHIFRGDIEWFFTPSILTNNLLQEMLKNHKPYHIVLWDGLKNFASEDLISRWLDRGGTVQVLHPINVKGIAINPYAPEGYYLSSLQMKEGMKRILQRFHQSHIPVFDIYLDEMNILKK